VVVIRQGPFSMDLSASIITRRPDSAAWSAVQATLSRQLELLVQRVTLVAQPGQQVQPEAAAVRRDPQGERHVDPQPGGAVRVSGQAPVARGQVPGIEVEQREVQSRDRLGENRSVIP
jgi:hypothetical protein